MPIYEYSCSKCGKTIEIIQRMSDKPLKTHSGCGGKLTKLISAAGFQFKGTGWYVTDYARKQQGDSSETSKDSKDSKQAESTKSDGADTKKEAAPEKPAAQAKAEKPAKPTTSKKQ